MNYELKKIILFLALLPLSTAAQTWKNYLSYHDITDVKQGGSTLYVLASKALFTYNTNDMSIATYDKANAMSDCNISMIDWSSRAARLIVIYENGNIDIMDPNGQVTNMPDYMNKSMTEDKTIYGLDIDGTHAYVSTGFGILNINLADAEITDTYNLGFRVDYCYTSGGRIYAASSTNGTYSADTRANLLDPGNWTYTAPYTPRQYTPDPELMAQARTLSPGGPKYNYFYNMKFMHNRLYTSGGFFMSGIDDPHRPGTVQVMQDGDWTVYQDQLDTITGYTYESVNCVTPDPADPDHVYASGKSGIYEFRGGQLERYFNRDNSMLEGAVWQNTELGNSTVIVHSTAFDAAGSLWMLNAQTFHNSIIEYTPQGEFISHHKTELMRNGYGYEGLTGLTFDSRGLLWFISTLAPQAIACYQPSTDGINVFTGSFNNQDGTVRELSYIRCLTEDLDGNIWIGTNLGPFYLSPSQTGSDNTNPCTLTQFKVPRNDGTNFADYLLAGLDITAIAIDGGGRKWMGTGGNGVYLISADNLTQIQHFTAENSALLSNNIESIAINGSTGEVFFGTDNGLCSYLSDATAPNDEMTKDNVRAYPNPVRPGYTGMITITGLTIDADVKIVTSSGALVAQGRSTGGSFQWDGCDLQGRRVASGVYMVQTATSTGGSGTVCKVAVVN